MSKMIVCGRDCENCQFSMFYDDEKNLVFCVRKNRKYYYGQKIPCEEYKEVDNQDQVH